MDRVTSGSSIACDDAHGRFASAQIYEDDSPLNPMLHRIPRIEIDHFVREAGIRRGMRTIVICPTMIHGKGLGLRLESDQIPKIEAKSRESEAGVFIGKGETIWSSVYIGDVAELYLLALKEAPSASFFFAENGEANFKEKIGRAHV